MPDPKDDPLSNAVTTPLTGEDRAPRSSPQGTDAGVSTRRGTPSPEVAPAPFHVDPAVAGALAARYELLGELGRGGMGVVYRARDLETRDIVALKVLLAEIAADREAIERFKSELLLARKITHKNVCRVHDLNRLGDVAFISMEFIEGESLRAVLRRFGSAPLRRGLAWARQICSALAEAHAQGVVHRDLKPENILIARDSTAKVMDFGIARSLESSATRAGDLIGTPAYMSPEQAAGKPADHRSDIYSLGLILYEMFAGQPPFKAETGHALVNKQLREIPRAPLDVEPLLPRFLDRAILKCLEKDPQKRFQSVAELDAALTEQRFTEALPEGDAQPSAHLTVWRRADWALAGLAALGLIYFLAARDRLFPASRMKLEVEAISARRTAEEVAQRLNRPFPELSQTRLLARTDDYHLRLTEWAQPVKGHARPPVELVWQPGLFAWRVEFRGAYDHLIGLPQRFAVVDHTGRVEEFSNPHLAGGTPANYQPPNIEERRAKAQKAAETVCGGIPEDMVLRETSSGERNSLYTAEWRSRRMMAYAFTHPPLQVRLQAEQVLAVDCKSAWETSPNILGALNFQEKFGLVFWLVRLIALAVLMGAFLRARCYAQPGVWKHLPAAIVFGLAGTWFYGTAGLAWSAASLAQVIPLLIAASLAGALILWVGFVTADYYLRRRAPELVATYLLVRGAKFPSEAVGLSVLRGCLLGLGFIGVETLIAHTALGFASTSAGRSSSELPLLVVPLVDPSYVGQALTSFSPALFVLNAAIFAGPVMAVILLCMGLFVKIKSQKPEPPLRTWKITERDLSTLGVLLILPIPLAAWELRPLTWYVFAIPESLLLVWLLRRFDVLTMLSAVSTAVLWNLNYPLLVILSEVGNAAHWALFLGWGLVVLAATAISFRAPLTRALRHASAPE